MLEYCHNLFCFVDINACMNDCDNISICFVDIIECERDYQN